jgi:nucleotide-binding universal stress UspA family protein
MYYTILVPLDQSKRAEAILPHVENLATLYGARVIFLVVVEPLRAVVASGGQYSATHEGLVAQEKEIANYLAGLQGEFREKGIESVGRLAHGPVVAEIIRTANTEDVDLIAIASHGRGGLSRVFYGSVAAGVLQRIDRPLLIIRALDER